MLLCPMWKIWGNSLYHNIFWSFHEGSCLQLLEDAAVSTRPNYALEEASETQNSSCGVWAPPWKCSGAKEGQVAKRIMFWRGSTEI